MLVQTMQMGSKDNAVSMISNINQNSKGNDVSFQSVMNLGQKSVEKKTQNLKKTGSIDSEKSTSSKVERNKSIQKLKSDKSVQQSRSGKDDSAAMQKVDDALARASKEIKKALMKQLDISLDELDALMQQMGITASDLLNNQTMVQILMKINGMENPAELLGDEKLTDMLKQLASQIDDILENNNLRTSQSGEFVYVESQSQSSETTNVNQLKNIVAQTENSGKNSENVEIIVSGENMQDESQMNDRSFSRDEKGFQQELNMSGKNTIVTNGAQVVQQLDDAFQNVMQTRTQTVSRTEIVNQILEAIKVNVKSDITSMQVQLHPESLGRVTISVASKNGIMTAQITAQTDAARNAIESQLSSLKESFQNQGLKVEEVEVTVSAHSYGQSPSNQDEEQQKQNQGQTKERKQINLTGISSEEEMSEEDEISAERMLQNGNSVEFSA